MNNGRRLVLIPSKKVVQDGTTIPVVVEDNNFSHIEIPPLTSKIFEPKLVESPSSTSNTLSIVTSLVLSHISANQLVVVMEVCESTIISSTIVESFVVKSIIMEFTPLPSNEASNHDLDLVLEKSSSISPIMNTIVEEPQEEIAKLVVRKKARKISTLIT